MVNAAVASWTAEHPADAVAALGLMLADPLVAMLKVALERQSEKNEGT